MLSLRDLPRDDTRLLRLDAAGLPPGLELVPVRATLREAIDQPYELILDLLAAPGPAGPDALLGTPLALRLKLADGRWALRHGLVDGARHGGAVGALSLWRLVLRPALAALALRQDSRVFTQRTALQVVECVLSGCAGLRWRLALGAATHAALRVREVVTQYRESDLGFIARLLAQEGLHWRFEHEDGADGAARHVLVIADATQAGPALGALSVAAQHPTAFRPGQEDPVTALAAARRAVANAVALGSWDPCALAGPAALAQAPTGVADALPRLRHCDGAGLQRFAHNDAAQRAADQALWSLALRARRLDGTSGVRRLAPGACFTLPGHPVQEAAEEGFTVLAVEHRAANNLGPDAARALDFPAVERGGYGNRFQAVPRGQPLLPPQPPRRAAPAALGARVAGAQGATLASDRDHRVKAQFHFQRGRAPNPGGLPPPPGAGEDTAHAPGDARCGAWLRLSGPAAGADWGTVLVPRVGAEVAVGFLDGDVDRPVVTGGLYHAADMPPFAAGVDAGVNHAGALSGLHSRGADGAGFNQWVMDDSRGQLRTRLHAGAAHSELALGHLVRQGAQGAWRGAWRGAGFESCTQGTLAVRAGAGLLLSTRARPGTHGSAQGPQMDAAEALAQLRAARELGALLGGAARAVQAPGLRLHGVEAGLQRLLDGIDPARRGRHPARVNDQPALQPGADGRSPGTRPVPAFDAPLALLDGAAAALFATDSAVHAHAGAGLAVAGQGDVEVAAAATLAQACGGTAGLYAHQGGITARAAHGPVSLRAHAGLLRLLADGPLTVLSTGAELRLVARRRVRLVGGDSALTLDGTDIELRTPGAVTVRGVVHEFLGPKKALDGNNDIPVDSTVPSDSWQSLLDQGKRSLVSRSSFLNDKLNSHVSVLPEAAPSSGVPAAPLAPSLVEGLGSGVDELLQKSPALQGDLAELKKKGWDFKFGVQGKGSYVDRDGAVPAIVVDPALKGRSHEMVQVLSHEVGHAMYGCKPDLSSKKAYVKEALADEAAAVMSNIRIQRDILAHGGPDVGIAGHPANHQACNNAYDILVKDGSSIEARNAVGSIVGEGEKTSTTDEPYAVYYGRWYEENIEKFAR